MILDLSLVIDTRSLELFQEGHIPGSISVIEAAFTNAKPESLSFGLKTLLKKANYTIILCDDELSEVIAD